MAKTNIGLALGAITSTPVGVRTGARVAQALTAMPSGTVRSIDSDLNFILIPSSARQSNNFDDLKNTRRAAILLSKTLLSSIARPNESPTSWSEIDLDAYVGAFRRALGTRPTGVGMYLGPSFWAYSDHADREQAKAAWAEGANLLKAGIRALSLAQDTRADNLYRRWFGDSLRTSVQAVLDRVKVGLASTAVGLAYSGEKAAVDSCDIEEEGFAGDGRVAGVHAGDGWGVGKYQIPVIGLERKFFSAQETTGPRSELHGLRREDGMQVSRGGAVLHECTHVFANTVDAYCNDAVYQQAGLLVPTGGNRAQGYGPFTCSAMAIADAASALTNADSYRLYCEDAAVLLGM
jgi:hypothetical protein